jgi:hypothetical protein
MMPSKSGTESGQIEKPRGALTWLLRKRHACPSIAGTHSGVISVAAPRGDSSGVSRLSVVCILFDATSCVLRIFERRTSLFVLAHS